jgi:phosphoribosyl 1,2-cyclic phosphodiesterase
MNNFQFFAVSMSLFIASLNSGSNGNCYYIGNGKEAVLIDAGISCRETERRMARLELSMEQVKAVFISHEHTDHISGVGSLSRKYKLPVYITLPTLKQSGIRLAKHLHFTFEANQRIEIGALTVIPFSKFHDAADPFSFIIEHNGVRAGVFTDIGMACSRVIHYFKQCHACFLESNYDEQMLEEGSYPLRLKKRIRGGHGHLSNAQALELFRKHKPPFMTHLLLSHLSKNNNRPEIAMNLFAGHAKNVEVAVASRYKETALYSIKKKHEEPLLPFVQPLRPTPVQLTLFD